MENKRKIETKLLSVDARKIGKVAALPTTDDVLDEIDIKLDQNSVDAVHLQRAAEQLRSSNIPVAFPTETVYGLGADATRSDPVKGIYTAKQRPADNPLIVHFASLKQLRELLKPPTRQKGSHVNGNATNGITDDPIPEIYKPIISKFWPGPLTIILPNPSKSPLAPGVTAGLDTFGARMPKHVIALALIQLSGKPIAAPSANASTKPSPTAAEHVAHDLDGRIETIIDGGPCDVGVESTVVDGLSDPPLILRPGGISIEQLRSCPGWANTQVGYQNAAESGSKPKAPGMKYRHYSPRASVVLYEFDREPPSTFDINGMVSSGKRVGVITTRRWSIDDSPDASEPISLTLQQHQNGVHRPPDSGRGGFAGMLDALSSIPDPCGALTRHTLRSQGLQVELLEIRLGYNIASIARGIFSALRELDKEDVDAILVEGIDEKQGDTAAAVMNRLRKAAEVNVMR